jgi:hypothetical protein
MPITIPAVVTPTAVENVYRVAFTVSEDEKRWTQIVCFVYTQDSKIEIAYYQHTHHSRTSDIGPWTEYAGARLPVTGILETMIRCNVAVALMDYFIGRVRPINPTLERQLEKLEND